MLTISLSPDWQRKKCPSSTDLILDLFKNLAIWFFLWPVSWSKGTFSRGRNCISGFQLLQVNIFPFSRNSHFQIYKILLPWCDSSFVLSTIIPITTVVRHPLKWKEQEKSGAEQFGSRFDFASNLNLPLKNFHIWSFARVSEYATGQYQLIFSSSTSAIEFNFSSPIPFLISNPFVKCTLQAGPIIQSYPHRARLAASLFNFTITSSSFLGKSEHCWMNFQDCSNGGPKLDWAVNGAEMHIFTHRPCSNIEPSLDLFHKHKWFIRFVSNWCWGWRTKTENDSKSI